MGPQSQFPGSTDALPADSRPTSRPGSGKTSHSKVTPGHVHHQTPRPPKVSTHDEPTTVASEKLRRQTAAYKSLGLGHDEPTRVSEDIYKDQAKIEATSNLEHDVPTRVAGEINQKITTEVFRNPENDLPTKVVNEDIARIPDVKAAIREIHEAPTRALYPELAKEVQKATAELASSPTPQFPEDDITVTIEMPLNVFLEKNKLEGDDAYLLHEFLKKDSTNVELWDFIVRISPKPVDALILKRSLDLLSPELIHALLVVGSKRERFIDEKTGKSQNIFVIKGAKFADGGISTVSDAYYAFEDNLHLTPCLYKTAFGLEVAVEEFHAEKQAAFKDELAISRYAKKIIEENSADSRTSHILSPIYVGTDYILMPKVTNRRGEVCSLSQIGGNKFSKVQDWAKVMAGAVEGNNFLSEHGIINADFKSSNILEGEDGEGVVIDLGSFLNQKITWLEGKGNIVGSSKDSTMYPLIDNEVRALQDDKAWESNRGNIPKTATHVSVHLMSMELDNKIPAGSTHKFLLSRCIQLYFERKYSEVKPSYKFSKLSELEKLNTPLLDLHNTELPPGEKLLYELYSKLHQAHFHPSRFKDRDPNKGLDPEYISSNDIVKRLKEIAKLPL